MHSVKRENAKAPGPCEETHLTWSEHRGNMSKSGEVHTKMRVVRCACAAVARHRRTHLVVAIGAFDGTLALQMPVRLHSC